MNQYLTDFNNYYGTSFDCTVCHLPVGSSTRNDYANAFANERLRVSIRKPAPMTETAVPQVEWGMTGKHVGACGEGTATIVRGTIIADETLGTAHMGIFSLGVRGHGKGEGAEETCNTVSWNCSASEPVRAPDHWLCESRNEFDDYHGSSTQTKITAPEGNPLCGVFEHVLIALGEADAERKSAGQSSKDRPAAWEDRPFEGFLSP